VDLAPGRKWRRPKIRSCIPQGAAWRVGSFGREGWCGQIRSREHSLLKRAVARPFHGRVIRVTTAEDLVLLKMAFHRQKDLLDIKGILHVQKGRLDIPYLRHWSGQMLEEPVVRELDKLIATYEVDRPA
jgi:hypothetical protein